jgi:hypothetical protein
VILVGTLNAVEGICIFFRNGRVLAQVSFDLKAKKVRREEEAHSWRKSSIHRSSWDHTPLKENEILVSEISENLQTLTNRIRNGVQVGIRDRIGLSGSADSDTEPDVLESGCQRNKQREWVKDKCKEHSQTGEDNHQAHS